jgi:hypothetical protein
MYNLEDSKKLLGFEPRDRWPEGIEDMTAISNFGMPFSG